MQVITDAKELEKHTYIKTRNPAVFPKKERLGLAQRMICLLYTSDAAVWRRG